MIKLLRKTIREICRGTITKRFTYSSEYWQERYHYGGNSGRGSYNNDARIKADFLNNLVQDYNLENVVDVGCGDGNNLSYFNKINYFGIDLSETIIKENKKKFFRDINKKFYLLKNNELEILNDINSHVNNNTTVVISFDVIFHLVEDFTYNNHLNFINNTNANYCLVTSSDKNLIYNHLVPHVRHRNYSKAMVLNGWNLLTSKLIPNCPDKREIKFFVREKN